MQYQVIYCIVLSSDCSILRLFGSIQKGSLLYNVGPTFYILDHCVFEFDSPGLDDPGISTALMAVPVPTARPGASEHV